MKKYTACLLTLLLLCFAACAPAETVDGPESTAETTLEAHEEQGTEFTEEGTSETILESTTEGETSVGETSAGETTTAIAKEVSAPVGGSTAQIVTFYNQHANQVKAATKITIKKHDKSDTVMDIPAIAKAFMGSSMEEMNPNTDETTTETFVNGKGVKDSSLKLNEFLPVSGKSIVSQLKASHVQSASCTKQSNGWVVKITLKDEAMDMSAMNMSADMSEAEREKAMDAYLASSGYGSSMDMGFGSGGFGGGRPDDAGGQAPGNFDSSSMDMESKYQNGSITAVFNAQGQMTSLALSHESNMSMSMLGMKMSMNSTSKQEYQFTW